MAGGKGYAAAGVVSESDGGNGRGKGRKAWVSDLDPTNARRHRAALEQK